MHICDGSLRSFPSCNWQGWEDFFSHGQKRWCCDHKHIGSWSCEEMTSD